MSRKKLSTKNYITPDPIYNSQIVSKLINATMKNGKKNISQKIVYNTIKNLERINNQNPVEVLKKAIENITPTVEIKPRRIGGAIYQIPVQIKKDRAKNLAIKILIKCAKKRNGKTMSFKLLNEIIDSYNNIGNSIKKKEEIHKMAEANKAFAMVKI